MIVELSGIDDVDISESVEDEIIPKSAIKPATTDLDGVVFDLASAAVDEDPEGGDELPDGTQVWPERISLIAVSKMSRMNQFDMYVEIPDFVLNS